MDQRTARVILVGGPLDGEGRRHVDLDLDGEPPLEHAFIGMHGDVIYRLACSTPDAQGRLIYVR